METSIGQRALDAGRTTWRLLKDAGKGWSEHDATRLGAALAYYTVFALGPLLLIAISVAGLVFGQEAANDRIVSTLNEYVGQSGAEAVQVAIASSARGGSGWLATLIGIGVLLFAAGALFAHLKDAFNVIWGVEAKPGRGLRYFLKKRFLSFAMVLGTGFLLLVSLVITAALAALAAFFHRHLPGGDWLWRLIDLAISFGVVTGIFALIFKWMPDVKLGYRDVLPAAITTSLLFSLGKQLLALYISKGNVGSSHGAAGSLIVVLVWVFYSSQILFFGAELSRAWVKLRGIPVQPARFATFRTCT
jgi:membrane protein